MQQQNTIANPQSGQPKVKGPQFTDRDYVNDALTTEKYLTDSLNIFSREASHQTLHSDVNAMLMETHGCARDLFNLMFRKGWYKLEPESQQKLQKTQQQFSNYQTQLPYGNMLQQ